MKNAQKIITVTQKSSEESVRLVTVAITSTLYVLEIAISILDVVCNVYTTPKVSIANSVKLGTTETLYIKCAPV